MIPRAHIIHWQAEAPWANDAQIEQDLILSRAIVELFRDPPNKPLFAFRGGTALHKIHLAPASRYSEDIDLVQIDAGPAKDLFRFIRGRLDPWLGEPKRLTKRNGIQLLYYFETTILPVRRMRVKVEVNTREHFSVLGFQQMPFSVESPWFQGQADVTTYALDELLGTKLRALYQRKKGRDLFDLWDALKRGNVSPLEVVRCFTAYLDSQCLRVSQREFVENLKSKLEDPGFISDTGPILRQGLLYDCRRANEVVEEALIARLRH
ncbi:MAG: nucleotidyl transferase AbiEii/AbiGii toxin family protein [Dehalococcoidia bacterium]|nr:nucleotidyl transferase AbiEii/AbiGii toxin family protein [Dehalococcoidia bacterium]